MLGSVKKAISKLMKDINENPFLFFKERDIHSILYNHLRNEFPKLYEFEIAGNIYKTSLVHGEYYGRGSNERIDLVVFHPDDIKNIQIKYGALSKKVEGFSGGKTIFINTPLDLKAAIEIKFNFGASGEGIYERVEYDISKLEKIKKSQEKKVELHFIYLLRWPSKQEEVIDRESRTVRRITKLCDKQGIIFHTNSHKNYFPKYK